MLITDLPFDALVQITSHLDGYSLISLSKCCLHFKQLFATNCMCSELCFSNDYCVDPYREWVSFEDMFKMCASNRRSVTRLDLSRVHWLTYTQIRKLVAKLPIIQDLNLIETSLTGDQVTQIVDENDTINSLSASYERCLVINLKNRRFKRMHFVLSIKYCPYPPVIRPPLKVDKLKLTSYDATIPYPIESLIDADESTLEVVNYCTTKNDNSYVHHFQLDQKVHFIYVECYNKIYISEDLVDDFSNYSTNIIAIENYNDYQYENFVNVFTCKKLCPNSVDNFKRKVRHRLLVRSEKIISLCSEKFCAYSENFDFSDITSNLTMAEHLILPTCYLSHGDSGSSSVDCDAAEVPIKLRRISRISTGPDCTLSKIVSVNANLKALLLKDDNRRESILNRCSQGANYPLHANLLSNLTQLQYFGVFSDSILSSPSFLSDVLKHCKNLTTLVMVGVKLHDSLYQSVTSTKCLSTSLKHFSAHFINCRINHLVLNVSKCPSLESIHITYQTSPEEFELSTVKKLTNNCKNIRRIHIVEKSLFPSNMAMMKRQMKIERASRLIKPKVLIKLTDNTKERNTPLYPYQFYDLFQCS